MPTPPANQTEHAAQTISSAFTSNVLEFPR